MNRSFKPRKTRKRPLGLYRGQIWMAPDFDAPMELVEDGEGWHSCLRIEALARKKEMSTNPAGKASVRKLGQRNPIL